jgi:hypothetical protein
MWKPRNTKPSSRWVMWVFSSERVIFSLRASSSPISALIASASDLVPCTSR